MMSTIELKNNFHELIDSIEDENILSKFYSILHRISVSKNGQLWDRISDEEQQDLLKIDAESDKEENLISQSEMQKKHKKGLQN